MEVPNANLDILFEGTIEEKCTRLYEIGKDVSLLHSHLICFINIQKQRIEEGNIRWYAVQLCQSNKTFLKRENDIMITEDELVEDYIIAVKMLTINEENILRKKVVTLTIEKSRLDRIEEKTLKMEQMYKK